LVQHEIRVNEGGGSTVSNFRIPLVEALEIPSPSLPEQRAIAGILGALDDKIELNRRMNETLDATARAIFKSWFVDLDPVRAKGNNSKAGVIPDDWHTGSVYELAEVIYGAPFASEFFNADGRGLPLIRIRDLATHNPEIYTPEQHPNQIVIEPGDVVVGMDGEFRVHHWKGPNALLNQRVCVFRPKPGVPRFFLSEVIRKPLAFYEGSKTGTTVIHLGKSDIDKFNVLVPDLRVLGDFGKITDPLLDRILLNARESRTLLTIRDALLPKLLSGEVRIRIAKKMMETSL